MDESNTMKITSLMAAAALVSACATAPDIDPKDLLQPPAAFKDSAGGRWTLAAPAAAMPRGEWWKAFGDPVLDDLEARATNSNNTVRAAAARLAQARAMARGAESRQKPQLDAQAGASRLAGISGGTSGPARSFGFAGSNLSYELDLFGQLSEASRAVRYDEHASAALLESARLLVQAEVAQAYLALRAIDDERALVRGTVKAYQDTLDLTERRYRAGDVAELDVSRARTEVAATQAEALALDRERAELENALAVLVGAMPTDFTLAETRWDTALPVIPAGVPSTVLTRRPDVSAAQARMLGAQARVHVANKAWFPDVSLTAAGGYASSDLSDVFKWTARAWGVGALLSLPLLDGGRRDAAIAGASGQLDEAVAVYRDQVLVAFRDVEDQLAGLRLLHAQADAQAEAVKAAMRTTSLSDARYRNGLVSQLDLLDARRSELRNRRAALQVRAAQFQATVGLVRALGGAWGDAA
jgi:multidrug efflux system outer membrane protein